MKTCLFTLFAAACFSVDAQTDEVSKVRVTGDRVSLRVRPDINAELLDRAMQGEELVFLGKTNGWVAVQAPNSLDYWVAGQYVQNGTVQPEKLNVRSGPSQNYSVVCVVNKGDSIALRGEFNEWLKIVPPAGSRVWISEDYTELIEPPEPEPEAPAEDAETAEATTEEATEEKPAEEAAAEGGES